MDVREATANLPHMNTRDNVWLDEALLTTELELRLGLDGGILGIHQFGSGST
jgi:hypothetical protein